MAEKEFKHANLIEEYRSARMMFEGRYGIIDNEKDTPDKIDWYNRTFAIWWDAWVDCLLWHSD